MSKPRYDWWPYVKGMIRRYPELKNEFDELHRARITQCFSDSPTSRNTAVNRTTEIISIRELPTTRQREFEAVQRAIRMTANSPRTGDIRMKLIDLVFWKGSHTLEGAALDLYISYQTARGYHSDFIYLVAKNYGLMDE